MELARHLVKILNRTFRSKCLRSDTQSVAALHLTVNPPVFFFTSTAKIGKPRRRIFVDSLPCGWVEEAPIIHRTISAMRRYRQYSESPSGAPRKSLGVGPVPVAESVCSDSHPF